MKLKGIDLSEHQGVIDWAKVKQSGIDFAVLRIGYGKEVSQIDKQFKVNYKACTALGVPIGGYWYSYATTVEDAKKEAETCLKLIQGLPFEYPIYYDIEERRQLDLGKDRCSAMAETFLKSLESKGYFVGLYTYKNALDNYFTDNIKKRFAVWVAHYSTTADYSKTYGMHQYSSSGKLSGIGENIDLDYCYIDYPKIIKSKELNGFIKPPTEPIPQPLTLESLEKRVKVLEDKLK